MGQNKNCVFVHFVWATFDRMPIVTDSIERVLYRNISQVCVDDGCEVLAIGGMPDHVHLLVKLSLTRSCSDLMKHAKVDHLALSPKNSTLANGFSGKAATVHSASQSAMSPK